MGEVSEAGGNRRKRNKIKISRTLVFVKTKVRLAFYQTCCFEYEKLSATGCTH